jgi:type II secretory pathway pseudopilin PulG
MKPIRTGSSSDSGLYRRSGGFTLIEIIVILAVISILVAILTPSVLKYIADAQLDRAKKDVQTISTMLNDLIRDTGQYPGNFLFTRTFICGPGTQPGTGVVWCTGATSRQLSNHLTINDPNENGTPNEAGIDYRSTGNFRWRGPYIANLVEDPWGNAYAINASTLVGGNTSPTWVISPGPDGVFQTNPTDSVLSADDVGIRIK